MVVTGWSCIATDFLDRPIAGAVMSLVSSHTRIQPVVRV